MNRCEHLHPLRPPTGCRFEPMESRLLLNNDPTFATTILPTVMFAPRGDYTMGIDGSDQDGDPLSLTAVSGNANVQVTVRQGAPYARLHFVKRNQTTGAAEDIGDVLVQLFSAENATGVNRFITLATEHINADGTIADSGDPFYTNVLMHRLMPGFMIQGGDAENGDGTGGSPLGDMTDAIDPYLSFAGHGVLAFANAGPNTSDSQFFITEGPATHLNGGYMIFGQLISGWEAYEQVINWLRDTNDMPIPDAEAGCQPVLQSVEVIQPGVDTQDGTVSIRALDGWTGTTYVDVTLNDGSGGTVTQRVAVKIMDIPSQGVLHTGVGQDFSFPINILPEAPFDIIWGAGISLSTASVSTDANYNVSVDLADDFHGLFQINLAARYETTFPTGDPAGPTITRQFTFDSETYNGFAQPSGVPTGIGLIGASSGGDVMDSVVVGNLLYEAAGSLGVEVYNVSDPAHPVYVGGYNTTGFARKILISGTTAYVADTGGGIVSLNIADPSHITVRDTEMPGTETESYGVQMALRGNVLFVAGHKSGLVAFDVTNPANLTRIGQIKTITGSTTALENVVEVVLKGKYAILSDFSRGYVVVDTTNPRAMKVASVWGSFGSPWGMHLVNNRLYVVGATAASTDDPHPVGFAILDVTNILKPKVLGTREVPNSPQHVTIQNETAVVGTNKDIVFIDISNESAPIIEYTFNTIYSTSVTSNLTSKGCFVGSRFYAPTDILGVVVFDASAYTNRLTLTRSAVIRDNANTAITVSVTGGKARLHTSGVAGGDILSIEYTGTKTGALYLSAVKRFTIGGLSISGSIGSISAPYGNLKGNFAATGSVGSAVFADAVDGTTFTIGPRAAGDTLTQTALTFGRVANLALSTQTPIRMLFAAEWLDTGAAETIVAPSIGTLYITGRPANAILQQPVLAGNFEVGLNLGGAGIALNLASIAGSAGGAWQGINGKINSVTVRKNFTANVTAGSMGAMTVMGNFTGNLTAGSMRAMTVMGSLAGSAITVQTLTTLSVFGNADNLTLTLQAPYAALGNVLTLLNVRGWLRNSVVTAMGNIGTVMAGGMDNTDITVALIGPPLPGQASDFFVGNNGTIRSVVVSGMRQGVAIIDSFIASNIVAPLLGSVITSYVHQTAGQDAFGLAAKKVTLWIGRFLQNGKITAVVRSNLNAPAKSLAFDDFKVSVV